MQTFQHIGLIGRLESDTVLDTVRDLVELLQSRKIEFKVESAIAQRLSDLQVPEAEREAIGELCDLAIVVGGDGSLLGAARFLASHDCAVLGINRGRLGFLTDIRPESVHRDVAAVLDGHFSVEERFLVDVVVERDGQAISWGEALNDVVINSGRSARMIHFDLFMDDEFVYRQDSDGLIVSTPTGSTAYALSGGGPIMHPDLDALVLVPMFPHTLSARPIVVAGDTEIKVVIRECHPYVSCDGQIHLNTAPGDIVRIAKKPDRLQLVHMKSHDFYAACRDKLGWSNRLVQ
jgi:NAD+ kinase